MSNISNFLAQKHGYKTILYCDQPCYDILKTLPYNEIKILPEKSMNEIPRGLWSMSKLVALSEIEEPSIVIDLDLFLFKPLDKKKLDSDIVFFHDEPYSTTFTDPLLKHCEHLMFPQVKDFKSNVSKNCAMIGGQDVETIKNVSKEIIELVIQNKKGWEQILRTCGHFQITRRRVHNDGDPIFCPVLLVEQIWMFDLFRLHKKYIKITPYYNTTSTLDSQSFMDGIFHVWGYKNKKVTSIMAKFSEMELSYKKAYKDYDYTMKFLKEYEETLGITPTKY
jgi:hypothetical protein